jgi:hypothetical protein
MCENDDFSRVLRYIDSFYMRECERPESLTSGPNYLEDRFVTLEQLRENVLSPTWLPAKHRYGYFLFLEKFHPELGIRYFTDRDRRYFVPMSAEDRRLLAAFVQCWREYLASDFRKAVREEDSVQMKSGTARALQYIDDLFLLECERPEGFARNARYLELRFVTLEQLRENILSPTWLPARHRYGYFLFLRNSFPQLSAPNFTDIDDRFTREITDDEKQLTFEFVKCWGRYLASDFRRTRGRKGASDRI